MNPLRTSLWGFQFKEWHELILPCIALVGTIAAGFLIRDILFRLLRRWRGSRSGHVAEVIMDALHGPLIIWALILGIYFALEIVSLPTRIERFLSNSLLVLWIVSLTIMATNLAGSMVRYYGRRNGGEMPATSLTRTLAQIAVAAIGIAVLAHNLGISIAPLVTALGVGGLAVALALQDTLGNLFGGFYVTIAGQVRLGDYIKLNTGEEGYVIDISWRSTTIRMLANNLIIMPNSKLSQAIVTNYHLPEKQMSISIQVGVSYDSDPDQVEAVLMDVAKKAEGEVDGLVLEGEISARFIPGFGDSSLGFQLNVRIEEFAKQYVVQHELRKRILKRFREEKIDMPFPTRTVYLKQ